MVQDDQAPPDMIPLVFFRTQSGAEPVREWLLSLPDEDCNAIGQ